MGKEITKTNFIYTVGKNPIPIVISLYQFVKEDIDSLNKIYLIHSERIRNFSSKKIAENIVNLVTGLFNINKNQFEYCEVSSSNFLDVTQTLATKFSNNPIDNFHVDLTGGTKMMVIGAYEYFQNFNPKISYVDDQSESIYIYDNKIESNYNLTNSLMLNADQLAKLHNVDSVSSKNTDVSLIKAIELIRTFNVNDFYHLVNLSQSIYNAKSYLPPQDENFDYEQTKFDTLHQFSLKNDKIIQLVDLFPELKALINDEYDKKNAFNGYHKQLKLGIEFFKSRWLEEYIHYVVLQINDDSIIHPQISHYFQLNNRDFEIDITLSVNYRFFGISCTTTCNFMLDKLKDKYTTSKLDSYPGALAICKGKGFEIRLRSNQIGGSHAGAIVVTCLSKEKVQEVKKDFSDDFGPFYFQIFGIEDLEYKTIKRKLKETFGV